MVIFSLTLVRHGETSHNKQNVIQGQLDVPLSSVGLQQAQKLGTHLQHQKYTHVYSSDLIRAKTTAENILKQSQVCDVTIIEDKKLRERKFGVIEGKSFKFLKEAAKKSNQSVLHMTPQGAETVHEVQARAHSFFDELCQLMKNTAAESSQEKKKCQDNLMNTNVKTNGASSTSVRGKRKREDLGDNCYNHHFPNGLAEDNSKILLLQEKSSTLKNHCDRESLENSSLNDAGCDHQCASTCSPECLEKSASQHQVAPTFTDEAIRSHLMPCKCETEDSDCPNVSLSPLVTQTSSSIKSSEVIQAGTSSNSIPAPSVLMLNNVNPTAASMSLLKTRDTERERRTSICSSNDENESSLDIIGNVLVVSHGGLLKELILYFVEKLDCSVPGGKKQAMRISPNAGLSKFTVSLADNDDAPKIICHQIHDKHHLSELGENMYNASKLTAENTAL